MYPKLRNDPNNIIFVKNIKELRPDLVILGGDNVTYGFNKKRNVQLAELFENLGVYWATVLGNHEGDGFMSYDRENVIPVCSCAQTLY